jgi:signal transduction histidine kinase/CheY-like chemotaxis protein
MVALPAFSAAKFYDFLDWFIPENIRRDAGTLQRARMFLLSHLFGPFLGHTITMYLLIIGGPSIALGVLAAAITAFWAYPFALRLTGGITILALLSVQNLIFAILWGCYHYGGLSSPFMPWLLTVPLLAFFYLGPGLRPRLIVLATIAINLIAFFLIYWLGAGFPQHIPMSGLSGIGIISTLCAAIYVSMMALYYGKVVSSQSELERKVQHDMMVTRELSRVKLEAERANRAKSEFLARISHELRTPLNAVIGYSEMLLEDMNIPGREQQCTDLRKIHNAGKHLLGIITDVLDFSKIEAGKMVLFSEPFDLGALVDDIVASCREEVAVNGNEFRIDCADDLGTVEGDASKLRRAILNVLSNAGKFTKGGRVTLSVRQRDGWLVFGVEDTGIGISPEEIPNLFENFGESEGATSSKYGGTRLGLALCRKLCRLMGGDVTVESELGKGSRFTIAVPAAMVAGVDGAAAEASLSSLRDAVAPEVRPVILAIDDDPGVLHLVQRMLEKHGYSIAVASSGAEGVRLAHSIRPALILLDVLMPEQDGWDTLNALRATPETRDCPIVLLTVSDEIQRGRALGATAHLQKPIKQETLVQVIGKLLANGTPVQASQVPTFAGAAVGDDIRTNVASAS